MHTRKCLGWMRTVISMGISIHLHTGSHLTEHRHTHIIHKAHWNTLKVKSNHLICDTLREMQGRKWKKNVTACLWRSMAQSSNGSNECHSFVLITNLPDSPLCCEQMNEWTSICIEGHDARLHESTIRIGEFCTSLKWKSCLINSLSFYTFTSVSLNLSLSFAKSDRISLSPSSLSLSPYRLLSIWHRESEWRWVAI